MPGLDLIPVQLADLSENGGRFRGEWADGELSWSEDFSNGVPANFTLSTTDDVRGTMQLVPEVMSGTGAPAYTRALHAKGVDTMFNSKPGILGIKVDLSTVPELAGKTISSIKAYVSAQQNGQLGSNSPWGIALDGVVGAKGGDGSQAARTDWKHLSLGGIALQSSADIRIGWWTPVRNANYGGTDTYIAGFEVYTTSEPYTLNEYVIHSAKMWRSTTANNTSEPGNSATWVEVPVADLNALGDRLTALEARVTALEGTP